MEKTVLHSVPFPYWSYLTMTKNFATQFLILIRLFYPIHVFDAHCTSELCPHGSPSINCKHRKNGARNQASVVGFQSSFHCYLLQYLIVHACGILSVWSVIMKSLHHHFSCSHISSEKAYRMTVLYSIIFRSQLYYLFIRPSIFAHWAWISYYWSFFR